MNPTRRQRVGLVRDISGRIIGVEEAADDYVRPPGPWDDNWPDTSPDSRIAVRHAVRNDVLDAVLEKYAHGQLRAAPVGD